MADQRRLLCEGDDEQYRFSSSDEDWEADEKDDEVPATIQSGWKLALFVTLVTTICVLSLGYILQDWANFMPTSTGLSYDHTEVAQVPDMGMDMGHTEASISVTENLIPLPTSDPTLASVEVTTASATGPSASVAPIPPQPVINDADKYVLSNDWDFEAAPTRREYHWTISEKEINPDGVYRTMILINEEYPGPLVRCNEGDTISVHVHNEGTNATALHWHGLYQNGTNYMDGTVGITQCPIAPGASFTYEFKVERQAGTYWYHGHQGVQSSDGLHGPLIVHSKQERQLQPLQYQTDRVVMLSDHYWDLSSELLLNYLASDAENAEPVPNSALVNGRGIRDCSKIEGRRCDNSTANVGPLPIDLAPGQGHRIRFINTGAFAEFQLSVDEHEFAITEVDGTDVSPVYFHRMLINPAQRYSIILNNNLAPGQSFWLRAKMISACFAEPNPDLQAEVFAPVRWLNVGGGANTQIPMSKDFPEPITLFCKDLDTTKIHPIIPIAAPEPTVSLYFRVNFEIGNWRLSRGKFNQTSWQGDVASPTLFRAIEGYEQSAVAGHINDYTFDTEHELVLQTEGIQVVDIMFQNFDDGNHPLHLHGYKFFIMAQGHGYPPEDLLHTLDTSNPLRRDTASVEAFGWTLLRVIADK
jgi:FtsP/CotA-like multicopper oxidase with cupredoxin domain